MNITPDRYRRSLSAPPRIAPIPLPAWLHQLPETVAAKQERRDRIRFAKLYEDATTRPGGPQKYRVAMILADLTREERTVFADCPEDIVSHHLGNYCPWGRGARVVRLEITGEEEA